MTKALAIIGKIIATAPIDGADRAYQLHHATCPTCRAAGANPNHLQRCPEGAQLWGTYQQAGDPPHFTWLRKRPGRALPT